MKLHKADVIITLGRGIHADGTIPIITQYRAEKAAELFKEKLAPNLLISAGYWGFQRFIPPNTEAKPMKEIAIKMGVPKSKIILEETSRDTLGNAYFTRLITDKNKWKKIIVVTSKDHYIRTKYYFEKVYGPGYELQFSLAKTGLSKKEINKIIKFEKIAMYLASLKKIKAGDLEKIKEYIFKKHIMYNGSILKKIIPFFIKQPYNK
jgi:uncharacterized SAM-binding protein YcdF (DUF218 family)